MNIRQYSKFGGISADSLFSSENKMDDHIYSEFLHYYRYFKTGLFYERKFYVYCCGLLIYRKITMRYKEFTTLFFISLLYSEHKGI